MTTHLIHGFNVSDGGVGSIGRLCRFMHRPALHDYGWVGLIGLRSRNDEVVRRLMPQIHPGDALVAHSNGCLIAWRLVEAGAPVSCVVCIQPALRRDTRWKVPVLCLYNRYDWVVTMGRVWGRFASVANPWRDRHGWGVAGRHGFDHGDENWDTGSEDWAFPARYHSGVFNRPAVSYWGARSRGWMNERTG